MSSVHKFLVPSQPSWRSLVTGRVVRECDCGYLTTTALAPKYLFLILPSGCLSFSRVMASKLVPRLSLLSFPSHPYSLIMLRVLIKHEYVRSNIYLIRIPNCLLLLLLFLFFFLFFLHQTTRGLATAKYIYIYTLFIKSVINLNYYTF